LNKRKVVFYSFILTTTLLFSTFLYIDFEEITIYNEKSEIVIKEENLVGNILNDSKFSYPKKSWIIGFNLKLDYLSINEENFYIVDSNNEKIEITIDYDELENVVIIEPENFYKPWEKYKIVVKKDVKAFNSDIYLKDNIEYKFDMLKILYNSQIDSNYEEYKKINYNYDGIGPNTIIEDDESFYNEIKLSLQNYDESLVLTLNKDNDSEYDIEKIVNYLSKSMPLLDNYVEVREYDYLVEEELIMENESVKTVKFKFDYKLEKNNIDKSEIEKMDIKVREKVEEILNNIINEDMEDWEKEKAIYDYIINNCKYNDDYENSYNSIQNSDYGVLIDGKALCGGYAKAFYSLMNEAGLRCIYLEGRVRSKNDDNDEKSILHAWNIVDLDSNFYQVDATWGSNNIFDSVIPTYRYFNIDDDKLSKSHTWDSSYYPICSEVEFSSNNLGIYNNVVNIDSYNDFYTNLKKYILNKENKILFRINNYNESLYNVESTINKMSKNGIFNYSFEYITNEKSLCDGEEEVLEIYIKEF
jgi:hypothetical protein